MALRSSKGWLFAAVVVLAPTFALAQSDADRATARQLGQDGDAALKAKDFPTALDRFTRALQLFQAPTLSLGLARAQAGTGHFVEARETYRALANEHLAAGAPAPFKAAIADAAKEGPTMEPHIGNVTINVTGPKAPDVTIDGEKVPSAALGVRRPTNPGAHTINATASGFAPAETRVTVPDGGSATASLAMVVAAEPSPVASASATPLASAPPVVTAAPIASAAPAHEPRSKVPGVVLLVAGGVLVAGGGAAGALAVSQDVDLKHLCDGTTCAKSKNAQSKIDTYNLTTTLSTAGIAVGAVGLIVGTILLVRASGSDAPPASSSISPYFTAKSAGLSGSF